MSIKEKAKELAVMIRESEEFQNVKSAESRLSLDPNAQDVVQQLQEKQQQIMMAQQMGQQLQEEEIKSLEQLQTQFKLNTTLQAIQKAQSELDNLLQEVNKTISEELSND